MHFERLILWEFILSDFDGAQAQLPVFEYFCIYRDFFACFFLAGVYLREAHH
jgi:hypothetical protein